MVMMGIATLNPSYDSEPETHASAPTVLHHARLLRWYCILCLPDAILCLAPAFELVHSQYAPSVPCHSNPNNRHFIGFCVNFQDATFAAGIVFDVNIMWSRLNNGMREIVGLQGSNGFVIYYCSGPVASAHKCCILTTDIETDFSRDRLQLT